MTYASSSSLLARFDAEEIAQRTDRSIPRIVTADMLTTLASGGSIAAYTSQQQVAVAASLAVLQSAQQDAYDTINGYVQGRYTVPLVTPPNAIMLTECDLARYFLYDDDTTDVVKRRYESALAFLKSLRDGKVSIGPVGNSAPADPIGTAQVVQGTPTFNNDTLAGY